MKNIILFLFLFFNFGYFSQLIIAQNLKLDWQCAAPPTWGDPFITDCQCLSPDKFVLVYSDGNKVGGNLYARLDLGKPYIFTNIHMIDEHRGFITAYQESLNPMNPGGTQDGILISTRNEFGDFEILYTSPHKPFYSLYFEKNNRLGFALGYISLRTEDGGARWTPFVIKSPQGDTLTVLAMEFLNENIGFCTAGGGNVLKTTDAGKSWFFIRQAQPTDKIRTPLFGIHFKDELHGVASGMYGYRGIITTSNGGKIWNEIIEIDGRRDWYHHKLIFATSDIGFLYGDWNNDGTTCAYTEDGGQTWHLAGIKNTCDSESVPTFRCICFANESVGYAFGDWFREFYKTTTGGKLTGRSRETETNPAFQFYPNPARETLTLEWNHLDSRQLKIYQATGAIIYESLLTSENKLSLPLTNWSDGIYFYTIFTENKTYTCKFVKE